jgi:hypothetical protein
MSKRIAPVVTVTVSLIIKLMENWSEETVVELLDGCNKEWGFSEY